MQTVILTNIKIERQFVTILTINKTTALRRRASLLFMSPAGIWRLSEMEHPVIDLNKQSKTQKLTISAMVLALYVVIMWLTQSFSFGAYQIRLATALYSLSYLFPFLVMPLGLANMVSNLILGGFGLPDILGGLAVGIVTAFLNYLIRRKNWSPLLVSIPIILVPGLGVAVWLSGILNISYWAMAASLLIGQLLPGILGAVLVISLKGRLVK